YEEALPRLIAYWKEPGGRTWAVGYMIGTSECRITGKESSGIAMLRNVLGSYPLSTTARSTISGEVSACSTQTRGSQSSVPDNGRGMGEGYQGKVWGKGGFLLLNENSLPISQIPTSPIPVEDLRKRLLPVSQTKSAAAEAAKRVSEQSGTEVVGPFAVVS